MRRLILLTLLASATLPAGAAKHVTVAQLEQALAAAGAAHKPDQDVARQIGGMELSERLSDATFARIATQFDAAPRSALALKLLADQSAFLDPPAGELPPDPAPDAAAQQRMLDAARKYVTQALPQLPNFLATRTINRYDDGAQQLKNGGWPVRAGLHLVDTSSREASVRDQRESQAPSIGSALWQQQSGLISGGEFGSTLGMIVADTAQGKVGWSHWEQAEGTLVAVFRYSVPKSASHYEVVGSVPQPVTGADQPDSLKGPSKPIPTNGVRQVIRPTGALTVLTNPAYHGSIWLEPATGTILRLTVEADAKEGVPFRRAAILVEYAPVQIENSKFICPVRSLALSVALTDPQDISDYDPTLWLNETLFSNYHRFASKTRILTDTSAPESKSPPDQHSEPKSGATVKWDARVSEVKRRRPKAA